MNELLIKYGYYKDEKVIKLRKKILRVKSFKNIKKDTTHKIFSNSVKKIFLYIKYEH